MIQKTLKTQTTYINNKHKTNITKKRKDSDYDTDEKHFRFAIPEGPEAVTEATTDQHNHEFLKRLSSNLVVTAHIINVVF